MCTVLGGHFDFYIIEKIGFRTARGWNKGTAISFITPTEQEIFNQVQEDINSQSM